jgi:hypothetical protein
MNRWLLSSLLIVGVLGIAARSQEKKAECKKPGPAAEMAKLKGWLGDWKGSAKMTSPTAEEWKKTAPEGAQLPANFAGARKWEWALGGHVPQL